MRVGVVGLLLCVLAAAEAGAQGIRIHMHGDGGYAADGVLFRPAGQPPFPAIVLIPDERGLTATTIEAAAGFAAEGYVVTAVDLNRGLAPDAAKRSDEQAAHDIDSALSFLRSQPSVRQDRIGALGWGSGGGYALHLAADPRVRAIAIEGVEPSVDVPAPGKGHAAVLASFGGREAGVSAASVGAFNVRLRARGITVDSKIYPDAGAGFTDHDNATQFRPEDAEDVARRTRQFFESQLKATL
jgi:carboxymethylenebutenolidase